MSGLDIRSRVQHLKIQICDGSSVYLQFRYANGNASSTERVSTSLHVALNLANELSEAVDEYLYNVCEAIIYAGSLGD